MSNYKIRFVSVGKIRFYVNKFFRTVVKFIQKHKLDGQGFTISGTVAEKMFVQSNKLKADKTVRKHLDKLITKQRRLLKNHFEDPEQGWDLDARFIVDDILDDLLKFSVSDYILGKLVKGREVDILFTSGKTYFVKRKQNEEE